MERRTSLPVYFIVWKCWTILVPYCLFILTSFHRYIFCKRNKGFCTFTCTFFFTWPCYQSCYVPPNRTLTPLYHEPIVNHWWKLAFDHYHDTIIAFLYRSVYSYRLKRVKTNDFSVKSGIFTSTIIRSIKHVLTLFKCKIKDNFFHLFMYIYSIMLH